MDEGELLSSASPSKSSCTVTKEAIDDASESLLSRRLSIIGGRSVEGPAIGRGGGEVEGEGDRLVRKAERRGTLRLSWGGLG